MYRDKTIIRVRKESQFKGLWRIRKGKYVAFRSMGISRVLRLISTLIQDKKFIYSIDIIIKRRR